MGDTLGQALRKNWSRITFGCWQLAPSEGWGDRCTPQEADAVVQAALDAGITAFDTAEGYGDGESERRLARALGPRKNDVVIISKIWPDAELSIASYQGHLEASLTALGRDYVDAYLIHWPGPYFDSEEKSARLVEAMTALKKSGKARLVGLSNFHQDDLVRLGPNLSEFSVNQVPYNLLEREFEGATRDTCRRAHIGYMTYSPTAQGLLAGRLDKEAKKSPTRQSNPLYNEPLFPHALKVYQTVEEIADEAGVAPAAVAVAWALSQDNIFTAVVGSRKASQVAGFAGAQQLTLDEDQHARLNAASEAFALIKGGA